MEKSVITEVVREFIEGKDLFLVNVECSADNVIDVVIDSLSGVPIDTCAELNKFIESKFDRDQEDYELTVSSASISEPFVMVEQYKKNIGREVEVWIKGEAKDIKKEGILTAVTPEDFTISYDLMVAVEGKKKRELQEFNDTISYGDVRTTRLIIKF
ncbi:MAG: ribosome assembly cofactor RimP [Rikenellaceae bacterium]